MLSVESPPPDPLCPSDSYQLKDVSDERPSHELALPEVDLTKPPVLGETHLPKFSIRDYVFSSRSKDIKTNWPFSLKNLQLCFKHGVKDPLPPFEHFDAVKNQTLRKCSVDDKDISNNITEEPSEPDDDDYVAALDSSHNTQLKEKLTENCVINTTTSWRCSEGDHNDFPSTVTSVSHFEIEESVPTNKPTSSLLLATTDTSLETSVEAEAAAAGLSVTHKLESTTRPLAGKKCRLVVKFGAQTERSSAEDIASNSTNVSETMASKVCPVCKTFSSSSNTTLNAHIDQCLSVESTPKWTVDSKLTRHRIKPRKIRTMVDIYSTASHCTLEDLDRRNGSNWATISSFPTQEIEKRTMPDEEKKQRVFPISSDTTTVDIGAVYIDENGTKVRILSKFDDMPSVSPSVSKVLDCLRPSKPLKGGKGSKFFSTKNKKCHGVKHNKHLRPGRPSKKLFSSKGHSSQIFGDQARPYGEKETYQECGGEKRVSTGNSVALRQWACSKRTGVGKKLGNSASSQPSQCKWPVSQELQAASDQSSLHTSLMRRSSDREFTKVSTSPISSPGDSVGTVSVSYEQVSDKGEQSPGRKRAGSPLSRLRIRGNVKRPLQLLKQNGCQIREGSTSVARDFQGPKTYDSTGIHKSLSSNEITGVSSGSIAPPDFPCVDKKLTRNYHASRSGAVEVSTLRKSIMSVGSEMVESNSNGIPKCFSLKESEVHFMEGVDEELVDRDFEADEFCDFMQNPDENQYGREDKCNEISVSRSTVVESGQNAEVLSTCKRKEITTWDNSLLESQTLQNHEAKNTSSSVSLDQMASVRPGCEGVRCSMVDIVAQPSYGAPFGENSEPNKLSHCYMIQSKSQHFNGALSRGEGPMEPNFFTGQGIFSSDNILQNVHTEEDLESGDGHGSCFPEVDPIPIPGPPGSFLPSPRDMGSEDFQGNSSLSTSRVQSSQDQQDCVDGDLSDSPVSAISMISNSAASRYNAMYFKPTSSLAHQLVEDKVRSSSRDGSFDSSVENTAQVPRSTSLATERLTFDGRDIAAVNNMSLSFKNDNQPCCCQRKERASQGVILNYQESQLLRRRTMASAMVPALDRHMGCNMSSGPDNLEGRSDIWPLSSCPSSKPAKVLLPVLKFPASPNSLRGSPDAGVKFSGRSDCDSISPSTSNSILRLMGKNLMVVNRDEDEQAVSHPQTNRLTTQLATFSGAASSHIQNQSYHSCHPNFPHGSVISNQDPNKKVGKCFETTRLHSSSRSHPSLKVSQMFSEGPASLFPNLQRDDNFMRHVEPHEDKADYDIADPRDKSSMNISSAASRLHVEKNPAFSDCKPKNMLCASNTNKEMIIIDDDVPEREDQLNGNVKRYYGGLGESHVVSSVISFPAYGANPFSCYQSQDRPQFSESPMVHNSKFHAQTNSQKNASSLSWSRTYEGSGVLQQSSYLAPVSPARRVRHELYKSPTLL